MKKRNYSLQKSGKFFLLVLLPLLITNLAVSLSVVSIVRQQMADQLTSTASSQIEQIGADFSSISRYMSWSVVEDDDLEKMSASPKNSTEYYDSYTTFFSRVRQFQSGCGTQYNFFVYLKDTGHLFNCAPLTLGYQDFRTLDRLIKVMADDPALYADYARQWNVLHINGKRYLVNMAPYQNRIVFCLVAESDLLTPFQQANVQVSLLQTGAPVSPATPSPPVLRMEKGIIPKFSFSGQPEGAGFTIQLDYNHFGFFEQMMILQALVMSAAFLAFFAFFLSFLYMRKRVFSPIRRFSQSLQSLTGMETDTDGFMDLKESEIVELEQVNLQFKNLMRQIRRLKIDIYEKELRERQVRLDYTKLQIRPHFFLNCLTNIYSMAQMGMNEEIQSLCLATSSYFRYIFQNSGDFVPLSAEARHIEDYLRIQEESLGEDFTYSVRLDPAVEKARIPPLVLQTFVENAVKHAFNLTGNDRISLSAAPLGETAAIEITDTGDGFPPDILALLQSGTPLPRREGHHIGINNTIERLQLLYQDRFTLEFSNLEDGGARVRLLIPNIPYTDEEKRGTKDEHPAG